jgi:hypothetical protein
LLVGFGLYRVANFVGAAADQFSVNGRDCVIFGNAIHKLTLKVENGKVAGALLRQADRGHGSRQGTALHL